MWPATSRGNALHKGKKRDDRGGRAGGKGDGGGSSSGAGVIGGGEGVERKHCSGGRKVLGGWRVRWLAPGTAFSRDAKRGAPTHQPRDAPAMQVPGYGKIEKRREGREEGKGKGADPRV
jgi:hypothetical protein